MSLEKCDPQVYAQGHVVAILNISKKEAEDLCRKATLETGHKHDWHHAAGRVVVKTLISEEVKPKVEAADCILEFEDFS